MEEVFCFGSCFFQVEHTPFSLEGQVLSHGKQL